MPMPANGVVWPPEHLEPIFKTIATHKALYQGPETPDLSKGTGWSTTSRKRGLVGVITDFLWGAPDTPTARPERHHVPLPSDIATLSADLLFSEAPRILPSDMDDEATDTPEKDRVDVVINNAAMHSTLLKAAEVAAALCGVYLRIVWDSDVAEHPILDVVYPDQAVPVWKWGKLQEVTFWSVIEEDKGGRVWRHLEHHSPGRIEHALFVGDKDGLGVRTPVTDHDDTLWLGEILDDDSSIETGSEHITAAYVPNLLPSRHFGADPVLAPFGRSDFEGVEGNFLDLDDAYSSWQRDIRLSRSRLFVDESALIDHGPGKGQTFNDDAEVYTRLRGYGTLSEAKNMIEAQQFNIRYLEHRETVRNIVNTILRATGYSPSTLGEAETTSQTTAKEVRSRESASKRTWTKKQRHWEAELKPLLETLLEVDGHIFNGAINTRIELEFKLSNTLEGDVVDLASTINLLTAAEAISLDQKLRMLYPNWSRTDLNEEADKIREEYNQDMPDPEVEGRFPFAPPPNIDSDKEE